MASLDTFFQFQELWELIFLTGHVSTQNAESIRTRQTESLTSTPRTASMTSTDPNLNPNYPEYPATNALDESTYSPHHHGLPQSPRNPNLDPSLDPPHPQHHDHDPQEPRNASPALPVYVLAPGNWDMRPPPASLHPSFTALHDFAQDHASIHGYALSINTTAKNRNRIKLACVCFGQAKNTHKLTDETRVRKNRQSAKTGCKMWIEGKRQDDGNWALRVGEGEHNHEGRPAEDWAVQRKRTWGTKHGRNGVGGVTAKDELSRMGQGQRQVQIQNGGLPPFPYAPIAISPQEEGGSAATAIYSPPTTSKPTQTEHSHARGSLVWKIVEQEMTRKGGSGGKDRGCGRTVKVLQQRLPGIQIYKRDVYNIRAYIRRLRTKNEPKLGEAKNPPVIDDDGEVNLNLDLPANNVELLDGSAIDGGGNTATEKIRIDPLLVAQCNDALRQVDASEVEKLRMENEELRRKQDEREAEMQRLREQLEVVSEVSVRL